jgi:hypothetical protein
MAEPGGKSDRPEVSVNAFPQLQRLAWNRPSDSLVSEPEALALYERNWHLVDQNAMDDTERVFLEGLVTRYGNGVLHV